MSPTDVTDPKDAGSARQRWQRKYAAALQQGRVREADFTTLSGTEVEPAYGTDGSLAALKLVALKDTKGAQAVYQPAPIIRSAVLKANPQIEELLVGEGAPPA